MSSLRGKNAAKAGRYGEDTAEALISSSGFPVCNYKDYDNSTPMAVRQFPTPHPYRPGSPRAGNNDFMLFTGYEKVFCQVKNQNSGGTCDEKLSFAFDIARFTIEECDYQKFALILLGVWWPSNPGIIEYAKFKCGEWEMLSCGRGGSRKAYVLVGPIETAKWLSGLRKETNTRTLFNKRQ